MPVSPIKRLTDSAKPWIVKALKDYGNDENINWEIGLTAFPDPAMETDESIAMLPALVLFLELPTDDPELTVYAAPIIAPYTLNAERVARTIELTLQSMRSARDARSSVDEEKLSLFDLDKS